MKIIVCGGRHSQDESLVWRYLDNLLDSLPTRELTVIQGGATGVDKHARNWCMARGINFVNYPYPSGYGRAGGPIRNRRMLVEGKPDLVVAFPGGDGTASMVGIAREHFVTVVEIDASGKRKESLSLNLGG